MASRDYLKHIVSTSEPTAVSLGDEWYNPTTNLLYKRVVTNGTTAAWVNITPAAASSTSITRLDSLGIGVDVDGTQYLHLGAGTATKAPLEYNAGTLMTSPDAGSVEYDGTMQYFTADATIGRGYTPTTQIFRLTANGTAFGPTIGNFFGINSSVFTQPGGAYEIEAYCYFLKTTAGTVTVTATSGLAPINLNGTIDYGAAVGGGATGAANRISLFNSTSTAAVFGPSASLTTATNHCFRIRLIVEPNALTSTLRFNFTSSAGTITPLRGSYYKVTRLPAANTGFFTA